MVRTAGTPGRTFIKRTSSELSSDFVFRPKSNQVVPWLYYQRHVSVLQCMESKDRLDTAQIDCAGKKGRHDAKQEKRRRSGPMDRSLEQAFDSFYFHAHVSSTEKLLSDTIYSKLFAADARVRSKST